MAGKGQEQRQGDEFEDYRTLPGEKLEGLGSEAKEKRAWNLLKTHRRPLIK